MSAKGDGSSFPVHVREDIFPACNVHSFIFSNPFLSSSNLVKLMSSEGDCATFAPIPPHRPVFYDPRTSSAITHSRLRRDTLRLAQGIHQRYGGPQAADVFGKGSRADPVVLLHLPNCIAGAVLVLGFLAAGWTVTATNPGYTVTELAHIVQQCEPRLVICNPGSGENIVRAACTVAGHSNVDIFLDSDDDLYGTCGNSPTSRRKTWTLLLSKLELQVSPLVHHMLSRFENMLKFSKSVHEASERVAFIMWTSGTTGNTKGAMISHRAIVAGLIHQWQGNPKYSAEERWIAVAPFYHIFGLLSQLLLGPCIGATVVVVPKFDLEGYLRMVSVHKATHLHIAPPIAVALAKSSLLDHPWCSLESVTAVISGGAPLPPEIILEVWNRINVVIKMGYGLTETGGVTSIRENTWDAIKSHLGSCGRPFVGIQVSIIDDEGKPVSSNVSGEIVIRSPAQMLGYFKNREATAATLDEIGVHTGDVGYVDAEGNIHIIDRIKELIKYKGFQVSPTELEATIAALPAVQDVAVSSIYSNAQGTELPLAYVVPRSPGLLHQSSANAEASRELVALAEQVKLVVEKNCVHYKRLRGGIMFVTSVPKSPSGKILRRLLKRQQGVHIDCYAVSGRSKL